MSTSLNLTSIAKKATSLSTLMDNRTRIETKDLVASGQVLTIIDFDSYVNEKRKKVFVYLIKEYPDNFAYAGLVLENMFLTLEEQISNHEVLINTLKEQGGIKVVLGTKKTKDGQNDCTTVDVIED